MGRQSSVSVAELVQQCAQSGDFAAWDEFVRRFHRLIAKVILRICNQWGDSSNGTVDELVQDTYLKLCTDQFRLLREFEHRHPNGFLGFLQAVAANVARDHFKSLHTPTHGGLKVDQLPDGFIAPAREDSPGSAKMIERNLLIDEIERHLDAFVSGPDQDRNRRIFWLRFRVGLSTATIADLPGINLTPKGVESLVARMLKQVREQMVASGQNQPSILPEHTDGGIMPAESF